MVEEMSDEMFKKRKEIKSKKPNFLRQDIHKKTRLKPVWKKPRGLQSKVRLKLNGYRKPISSGYSSPKIVRGLHPSGLKAIKVSNINDLTKIDIKKEGAMILSNVGKLKRYEIVKKAIELKIKILNITDVQKFILEFEKLIQSKKEYKSKKEKEKESKKKELEKLAEKKEKEDQKEKEKEDKEEISNDKLIEKKEEKKELDKILTKKEN
jgi:large subunit ribosomal protein L32e